tara:strand:- start:344 stop:481 length:138 start_codon:yes stop_codon:yes gene_type:complete
MASGFPKKANKIIFGIIVINKVKKIKVVTHNYMLNIFFISVKRLF